MRDDKVGIPQYRRVTDYQRAFLAEADNYERVFLQWDMRLGKTLTTLRWFERASCKRFLVVGPAAVLHDWQQEASAENIPSAIVTREVTDAYTLSLASIPKGVTLVSYARLLRYPEILANYWDGIALDESTRIRNPKAKASRLLVLRTTHIPRRICLSGCPAPESSLDLIQQYLFLCCGTVLDCANYWQFVNHYCRQVSQYEYIMPQAILSCLQAIPDVLVSTKTKRQLGLASPVTYQTRYVDVPANTMKSYRSAVKDYALSDRETKYRFVVDTWLSQLAGSDHKDKELINLLTQELCHQPVVVWFRYNDELLRIKKKLDAHGLQALTIYGNVSHNDRAKRITDFQKGNARILLVQIACGKFGLDFSAADTMIYFSHTYEYEAHAQSLERVQHIANKRNVLVIDLVSAGTIDEKIRRVLREKDGAAKSIMQRSFKAELDREAQKWLSQKG